MYATKPDLPKAIEGRQAVDMGKKYTMNILSAHNSKIQQYYCELGYIHFPWK